MKSWKGILKRGLRDQSGLEVVEYAIIVGLVVAAAIVAIGILGAWTSQQFNAVGQEVGAAPGPGPGS